MASRKKARQVMNQNIQDNIIISAKHGFMAILSAVFYSMWRLKRKEMLVVIACAVVAAALQSYAPQILQQLFDSFADKTFLMGSGTGHFYELLLLFVLVGIGGIIFKILSEKIAFYLATKVEDYWRYRALKAYYDLPISWHDSQESGEVVSRIDVGANAIFMVIYNLIGETMFVDILTLIFVLPLAYSANPTFFWILFVPIPIFMLTTYYISSKIAECQNRLNEVYKQSQTVLFDAATNIRTVKTFAKEEAETERYKEKWEVSHNYEYKLEWFYFIKSFIFIVLDIGTRALILLISFYVLQSEGMSIGQIVLLLSYQQLVFTPFSQLNWLFTRIRREANRIKMLFKIIAESDKETRKVRPLELGVLRDKLRFSNVSFNYRKKIPAIKNMSFTIEQGSTVALVGRSGAGKSTIAALIAGFYNPSKGKILWDGQDISKTNRASISNQVSYVAQDSTLFNRSIKENIAYAKDDKASMEEIQSAASYAYAHDFISSLRDGYKSIIGERGVKLSGGQRQRVALARALLAKGSLLILDESTSQLDSESERAIQTAIEKLRGKVTQVIIAHRLSTVLHADKILVIDKGRLVASGKHEQLLKRSKVYRKLYELQFQD